MVKIGVFDDSDYGGLSGAIKDIYRTVKGRGGHGRDYSVEFAGEISYTAGVSPLPFVYDLAKNAGMLPYSNILIINDVSKNARIEPGRECRAVLVNSDGIDVTRHIRPRSRRLSVITYGFNSKASVTASSVRDNTLTVCVQRAIPTLSGGKVEQQEFNVSFNSRQKDDISHLLAAVTAALVDG